MAELFGVAGTQVGQRQVGGRLAGDHLEEGVFAELVGHGLEDEQGGRTVLVAPELAALGGLHGLALQRIGGVAGEVGEHVLHARAGQRLAAEHREELALADGQLHAGDHLFLREGLVGEKFLHQRVVGFGDVLVDLAHIFRNPRRVVVGNGNLFPVAVVGGVGQYVYKAGQLFVFIGGEHDRQDGVGQLVVQLRHGGEKVAVLFVQPGHIEERRGVGLLELLPRLARADAQALRAHNNNGGVGHPQRLADLAFKGGVAGVVQNIQLHAFKFDRQEGGGDGIAALDLFGVKVADRVTVGGLAQPVGTLGHVEQAFGQAGLTVPAMPHQADVPNVLGCIHH